MLNVNFPVQMMSEILGPGKGGTQVGHIEGRSREQTVMFPEALDDYVVADNAVRVIDAWVDGQDLVGLGFARVEPAATGRPGYDPGDLVKLYVYGYMNRVRSSRLLERETHRNVELMWLMRCLRPDFKTIADFRKDNGKAIGGLFRQFVLFCQDQGLVAGELVAIDGSKFVAVNNPGRNFTAEKLKGRIERLERSIGEYLQELNQADAAQPEAPRAEDIARTLEHLRENQANAQARLEQLQATGESQLSLTDGDARAMKTPQHGSVVGYNVQSVVDSRHKLIVEFAVTNEGNDRNQLGAMALRTKGALGLEAFEVVADTGYANADEVARCAQEGITTYLRAPVIPGNEARGLYGKNRFEYDPSSDSYRCPAGQVLNYQSTSQHEGRAVKLYGTLACKDCPMRAACTTSREKGRVITRPINQDHLDAAAARAKAHPEIMRERKCLAEHPFGTLKRAWDQGYFLMRGMAKVSTEISLSVLSYNLKRTISILGVQNLLAAITARTA